MSEPRDKVILIIEDDESVVEFLKFAITKDGFRVQVAKDGLEALDSIKEFTPDLIITDMMLPYKSGYEIIKFLQNDVYRNIPVLAVSGKYVNDSFSKMLEFEPNVKAFMVKPIKIQILLQKIHSLLGTVSPEEKNALNKGQKLRDENNPWGIDTP